MAGKEDTKTIMALKRAGPTNTSLHRACQVGAVLLSYILGPSLHVLKRRYGETQHTLALGKKLASVFRLPFWNFPKKMNETRTYLI